MSSAYAYTVYRGTFIHLPRLSSSAPHQHQKLELVRHRGALWASSEDGRIKGCDWQARDDDSFQALMTRNGWVDVDASTNGDSADGSTVKVKVVSASEERNEFFFPGFIGTTSSYVLLPGN